MESPSIVQLVFILILLVGLYLIFTNSIQGRIKLVIIITVLILGLYLLVNSSLFKSYNELLTTPVSSKEMYEISGDTLKPANGAYTMSTWIYVDDWNYRYGQNKVIFKKSGGKASGGRFPMMYLDKYSNNLHIKLGVYNDGSDIKNKEYIRKLEEKLALSGQTIIPVDSSTYKLGCKDGYIVAKSEDETIVFDGTENDYTVECDDMVTDDIEKVVIDNIPLQKWVNIIMSLNNRTMDVYINGKLVKSVAFNNVINMSSFNNGDIILTPNGGYSGYIGHVRYYNEFITPQEAWDIYTSDVGGALSMGELTGNKDYGMSVTLYEDDVELNSYKVF